MSVREQGVLVQYGPLGHVAPVVVSSVPVLLPGLPAIDKLKRVLIYTDQDIIWTDDGQAPSAALGMILLANSYLVYDATAADLFAMVKAGATDANVRVSYHGI